MKKSEYLKKIVDRTEDVLEERGLSDEFTIYWDVDKIDGVKHPIMTIENPYGSETEFDLLSDYNRHEEEDISMSESFRRIKEAIIEYVSEYEDDLDEDEEIHDTNYFAEYDTYSPLEFANTMVELFNYRLGNNFHLSGMDLVDNDNLVRMDMNNANNEYQNNSMDFLEFGDQLTSQYQELKADALASEENRSGEENLSEEDEEQDSYPDEYLPF